MELSVDINGLKKSCLELEQIAKTIDMLKVNVENVHDNISIGAGTSKIKRSLQIEQDELKNLARKIHMMKELLEDIYRLYVLTEGLLAKDVDLLELIKEYINDGVSDIINDKVDDFEDWLEKLKKRKESIVFRIDDKTTREGLSGSYGDKLQEIYDDVRPEYEDTKKLYDKYSEDVVIEDFNTLNEDGKPNPRHSNGKIYINENADMNNPRGDGTTYYHEYGHFIVYNEKWIKDQVCQEQFNQFDEAIRQEVSAYIQQYEDKFEKEGIEKGYTGEELGAYVEQETRQAIKDDILGPNKEYEDANNGMSDIIDGVSNGKYEPKYGHPNGYWDVDTSRVANETFAHMFAAQMTGDTTELEKMENIMPTAYAIYNDMVSDAVD